MRRAKAAKRKAFKAKLNRHFDAAEAKRDAASYQAAALTTGDFAKAGAAKARVAAVALAGCKWKQKRCPLSVGR